jgi:hypothetical protein
VFEFTYSFQIWKKFPPFERSLSFVHRIVSQWKQVTSPRSASRISHNYRNNLTTKFTFTSCYYIALRSPNLLLTTPSTGTKVEAPITNRGPIADFIFKCHTFPRHISMKAIDNCLKLKLSGIGSSTLKNISNSKFQLVHWFVRTKDY